MSQETETPMSMILVVVLTIILIFIGAYLSNVIDFLKKIFSKEKTGEKVAEADDVTKQNGDMDSGDGKRSQQTKKKGEKGVKGVMKKFTHPWLLTSLKSHTGNITDMAFSPNGKYLVTTGDDRAAYVWLMKEVLHNNPKSLRTNIEFDHASKVSFSPDNKAFLVFLHQAAVIRVFKLSRKEDGALTKVTSSFDFPEPHQEEVVVLQIAPNGSFIAACLKNHTKLWDLKGLLFGTVDTPELKHACVSPCSKLLAVSGFTSQVCVWEVCFDKKAQYTGVQKAYFLDGHRAAILSFAYSGDSKRMVSLSKDRSWKLWDVDIDYRRGQEARLLKTWDCESIIMSDVSSPAHIAFSTNGLSVCIGRGDRVCMYNVHSDEGHVMNDLMIGEVTSLAYSPDDSYLVVAGHKTILLIHNVQGLKGLLHDLKSKEPKTKLMQERIEEMILSTKSKIASFSE